MADVERIKAEMLALEQWLDEDRPPLLALIVLSNGAGLAVRYPLLEVAGRAGLGERYSALVLIRAFLRDFNARIEQEMTEMERALLDLPSDRDGG